MLFETFIVIVEGLEWFEVECEGFLRKERERENRNVLRETEARERVNLRAIIEI